MKKMAYALALAAGAGLAFGPSAPSALAVPAPAAAGGLQIDIATPEVFSGDSILNLDVKFRGSSLRNIELLIDGTLYKKQALRTHEGRGTIRFALDSALVTEGEHTIVVRAVDTEGNTATATSKIKFAPGDMNSAVRMQYPRSHAMVQGVVPIEVKLDSSLHKPYVMFFVDNDFLALVNYPPYTYNWDSSRASNGTHVLGVEAYDGETLTKIKAPNVQINVNNSGGFTTRQTVTPDLNKSEAPKAIGTPKIEMKAQTQAQSGLPNQPLEPRDKISGLALTPPSLRVPMNIRSNKQPSISYSAHALARNNGLTESRTANRGVSSFIAKGGLLALAAGPKDVAALNNMSVSGSVAHQFVRPLRAGNVAARPSGSLLAVPSVASNAHGKTSSLLSAPTNTAKSQVGAGSLLDMPGGKFDISFDNSRITFDVQPRVERGLALAPFRAIFEHTGGKVEWFNKSKTMRAVNDTREIELQIGHSQARLNNQPITLETKPFIDHGRTMVPLSFVKDSLDVNVHYNAETGRLMIESKK